MNGLYFEVALVIDSQLCPQLLQVAGLVGRTELLAAVFFLLSLMAYSKAAAEQGQGTVHTSS